MFGKNIKAIRKERRMTQAQFAESLELTGKYISDLERGKSPPSDRVLQLIEINYRINRKWLETGQGQKYVEQETAAHDPDESYRLHGGYEGHTTDELTGDKTMSAAVTNLIKIYDSGDKKLIGIINAMLDKLCDLLQEDK